MIKIRRTGNYTRMLEELSREEPELIEVINRRIKWFRKNPKDTRLRNHALQKKMKGKWAFSITGDIRIVYEWLGHNTARFLAIGSHENAYS